MTSERYIKVVLTVIAVCLVYICGAVTAWSTASAQQTNDVVIIGYRAWDKVNNR